MTMRLRPAPLPLLAALALLPFAALAANPGDTTMFTLDRVTFQGNSRISTDTLNGVVGLQQGEKVNRDKIVDGFNNVVAEYRKENVGGSIDPRMTYPRPGHLNLTFVITEAAAPVVTHVPLVLDHETFTGNLKVGSDKLTPALTIKPGDTIDKDKIVADMTSISTIYKGAKQSVMITPKVSYPAPGHVDLNFELNENPPKR